MTGFIPVRDAAGKPYNGAATRYFVSASDSTALFIGDPVAISNTNTDTVGKYRTVTKATLTAGSQLCGVVVGVEPISADLPSQVPNLEYKHRPGSVAMYVLVADDPGLEFLIGEDGVGTAIAAADLGNLVIAVAGAGGSVPYGRSSVMLDSSGAASGVATGQYVIVGMQDRPDQVLATAGTPPYPVWRVKINEAMHQLATPGTSV